jgi:pyruvate dehydrogenase E1 component
MASARPLPLFGISPEDPDAEETKDWLESIDSVLRIHGAERAHYLLECMIDQAR